uniref:Uncharacterized protein n=1 Tax=Cucumis melo TaxID=3656 RepID=A0A9I9ECK9_CUCME
MASITFSLIPLPQLLDFHSPDSSLYGVSYLCWIWWGKANTRMVKDKDIEDEEDVKAIARLFADMGDSYVELIATSTSHPELDIASMTFHFWHSLQLNLTKRFCQNPFEQRSRICGNSLMYRHFRRFCHNPLEQ